MSSNIQIYVIKFIAYNVGVELCSRGSNYFSQDFSSLLNWV